jgi:hypothetical protein
MKAIYFLKRTLAAVMLMCCVVAVNAQQDFPATDQASFENALNQAVFGDWIKVSGEITLNKTIVIDKNVRIIGTTNVQGIPTATIKGNGSAKLFVINPPEELGEAVLFADVILKDGFSNNPEAAASDDFDGGMARILSGSTYFVNCRIEDNFSNEDAGAIAIVGDGTWVLFDNCTISNNNAIKRGGAFYIGGQSTTRFDYCVISNNKTGSGNLTPAPNGDRGGAFFIDNGATVDFFYCGINANASSWVKPEYASLLAPDAPQADRDLVGGGNGGGAFCINGNVAVTLEATSVRGNTSIRNGSHGGAVFGMGAFNFTLINTIVTANLNRGAGSFFMASGTGTFNMINSAWIRNTAYDNAGNGGGIRAMDLGISLNIFNSLIVGNTITQPGGAVDITGAGTAGIENNYVFKNSAIGAAHGGYMENATARLNARVQDNPNIPTKSIINYYNPVEETSQLDWMAMDMGDVPGIPSSGYDWMEALQVTSRGTSRAWQPIVVGTDSWIYNGADAALLDDWASKVTDFMNADRPSRANGSTFAGPLLKQDVDQLRDVLVPYDRNTFPFHTVSIAAPVAQDINAFVEDGVLYIKLGNLKGQLKGELVALNGQIVQSFNKTVTTLFVEPLKVDKGAYVLNVVVGGQAFAKTVIVQ